MKKIRKGIFAALAVFAAVTLFSCKSDDDDNSSSKTQNVEQPGSSDETGTGNENSGTDTSDTDKPGSSDETDTGNGDSGTDTPNPELPGTPGGTTNPKDIFAGKTFYDDDYYYGEEDVKFEFSGNGTMTVSDNEADRDEQAVWRKSSEYYYSISDNNTINLKAKSLYLDEKAYSYSEALELIESGDESFYLEELRVGGKNLTDEFDLTTEQGKIDFISFLLSHEGIFLDKSIDYRTAINKYIEYIKNESKEFLDSMFSLIAKFKYIQNKDGTISMDVTDSATFIDILSLDYSPFDISNFYSVGIEVYGKDDGRFYSLSAGDGKTISGKIYAVDETKIYGVIKVSDTDTWPAPYTEKVEFPYTTEGTGKNTIVKITYGGNTYTLTYDTYNFVLCPATSVTSAE